MLFVGNAFSVNMLNGVDVSARFRKLEETDVFELLQQPHTNTIRHPATMALIRGLFPSLADPVDAAIKLSSGDDLLVVMPTWKSGRPPETKDYTLEELMQLTSGVNYWLVKIS